MKNRKIGVLFVCLGNICRSPSAQGILQEKVNQLGIGEHFHIDSCGTAPFNVGKSPDARAMRVTKEYGYDISSQIARQIEESDFHQFDFIIPMDRKNLMNLSGWKPSNFEGEMELFMHYHPKNLGNTQIPDPYHEGEEAFHPIIKVIEDASDGLIQHIRDKYNF